MRKSFDIGDTRVRAGERALVDLPMPRLQSHTPMSMSVHVIHGKKDGPRLFVTAAIHGDELNGVEVIRRVLNERALSRLSGTLVAVPVVNVYGMIHLSRYLPDRRDLNRSFPGSERGSLAARLANLLMQEVVGRCTHGMDLHTGAIHRTNLPQIRANIDDPDTAQLARAFGVPVLLNASLRDGSLRQAAADHGIPMLLYEAGEALRFDEVSIRAGVGGVLNVMRALGMLPRRRARLNPAGEPFVAHSSSWTRAPESGMLRTVSALGAQVRKGETLGFVNDPSTGAEQEIVAHARGVVIGRTEIPLVHEGEAVYHIARFDEGEGEVAEQVQSFQDTHTNSEAETEEPGIV